MHLVARNDFDPRQQRDNCSLVKYQGRGYLIFFPLAVMGHMISTGLELMGTSSSACLNERLAGAVRRTVELANAQDITYREKLHVRAIELFSRG